MKLYLIERTDSIGYDEYDSWVICAATKDKAYELSGYPIQRLKCTLVGYPLLGPKAKPGIIHASFNAG